MTNIFFTQSAWALAGSPCFNFSFELRQFSFVFKRLRYQFPDSWSQRRKTYEKYDAEDHRIPVNTVDLNLAKRLYSAARSQFCCSDEFSELALTIMDDLNLQKASSFKESENLYFKLVEGIVKL